MPDNGIDISKFKKKYDYYDKCLGNYLINDFSNDIAEILNIDKKYTDNLFVFSRNVKYISSSGTFKFSYHIVFHNVYF